MQKKINNNRVIKGDAAIPLHPEGWSSLAAVYDGIWQYENAVYFVKSSAGKSKINEIRRRYSQNLRKGMLYENYISIYSIETKDISDEVCFFEEEKDNSIVYTGDENLIRKLCFEGTAKFETQIRLERW